MNPDKFLTDLAALTGCECVSVSSRPTFGERFRFEVSLYRKDSTQEHGWFLAQGEGPTVEAAMQEARAKLAAHYEGEPA